MATATATKTKAQWKAILLEAQAAGQKATMAAKPTPMVVYEAQGLSDIPKPGGKHWVVPGGVCGFATVTIKPATGGFVKLLKELGIGWKGYYGGWCVPMHPEVEGPLVQSLEIKQAYGAAYVKVLREAGIKCHLETRLD